MNEEGLFDDEYEYCPSCGQTWDKHTKGRLLDDDENYEMICNPLIIIMQDKPRYNTMDLNNYTAEFLRKIIEWQERLINYYKEKEEKQNE